MAVKLRQPGQHVLAAGTAILALAALLAGPVLAAPERDLFCDESADSTLAASSLELAVTPVNSSDELLQNHVLRPRTNAAVRGAFSNDAHGDDSEIGVVESESNEAAAPDPAAQAAQSAAERKRTVYRRQMYRRDI
jgi:hypothetical protein